MATVSGARTAIVGAGLMGRWHAATLARLGIPVVAIVDPDRERARALAARHPGARVHAALAAVLEGGEADVVHICTPRELHADQVGEALQAGCHVLAEKPLAEDAAETGELLALAAAARRLLCPVHQFPFQAGALRLQLELDRLGAIRHADFTACSAGGEGRSEAERAAIAADILPHPLSLLARLLSEPIEDLDWRGSLPLPGEIRATGTGHSVTASILVSMAGRPTRNSLRLIGEHGTAHLDLFHGFAVVETGQTSRASKVLHPLRFAARSFTTATANLAARGLAREAAYPGLRELVRRFHAAVAAGQPSPIPAPEVLAVARVRDRLTGIAPASGSRPGANPAKYYHSIRNNPGSRPGSSNLQPESRPTECAESAAS